MKLSTISVVAAAGVANAAPKILSRADSVQGFDISNYQSDVDFQGAYDSGARFVIIKVRRLRPLSININKLTQPTRPPNQPPTATPASPPTMKEPLMPV